MKCPFCKQDTARVRKEKNMPSVAEVDGEYWYYVECTNCHAAGPIRTGTTETSEAATAAWEAGIANTDWLLVVFRDNYADEFEVNGFAVFPHPEEWDGMKDAVPEKNIEKYLGTNEILKWDSKADYLDCFKEYPIDSAIALKIISLLRGRTYYGEEAFSYGIFPVLSSVRVR